MKIIKEKNQHIKQTVCDVCWSTIEYDIVKDVEVKDYSSQFGTGKVSYLKCPVCDSDINISVD